MKKEFDISDTFAVVFILILFVSLVSFVRRNQEESAYEEKHLYGGKKILKFNCWKEMPKKVPENTQVICMNRWEIMDDLYEKYKKARFAGEKKKMDELMDEIIKYESTTTYSLMYGMTSPLGMLLNE